MTHSWNLKKQRPSNKTVRVVCIACEKPSHITLWGLPNEWRDLVSKEKCNHCGITGKLATSELAKTRAKPNNENQLSLNWMTLEKRDKK